jgi:hypothetical protein
LWVHMSERKNQPRQYCNIFNRKYDNWFFFADLPISLI